MPQDAGMGTNVVEAGGGAGGERTAEIRDEISSLQDEISQVGKVAEQIDAIAKQTNLLALNATI